MALQVLREITDAIQKAQYYTLMADEVTDISNREQVAVYMRWIDSDFQPHEDFIGLYKLDFIAASKFVSVLEDTLQRMNLRIFNCRGQCYDGASNMTGVRNGVSSQISAEKSHATVYIALGMPSI